VSHPAIEVAPLLGVRKGKRGWWIHELSSSVWQQRSYCFFGRCSDFESDLSMGTVEARGSFRVDEESDGVGKHYLDGLKGLIDSKAPEDWSFTERRQVIRLECRYEIEVRAANDKRPSPGLIVDLGLNGMKLQTPQPLKAGDAIEIRFLDTDRSASSDTVGCEVLWTKARPRDKQHYAGLVYRGNAVARGSGWPGRLLEQLGFHGEKIHQRRKFVRTQCAVPAEIVLGHNAVLSARLNNLGVGGALIEATWPLSQAEESEALELRIGPFEGLNRLTLRASPTRSRAEGGRHWHGVEFGPLDAVQMRGLARYLFHLLRHHWVE
jgi:c-di-GMP-binding flagellar brake protein YcgR